MKITDVQAHLLAIPSKETDFPPAWALRDFYHVVVEIKTDEGITGYGDAFGYFVPHATASVVNHVLKPMIIGFKT